MRLRNIASLLACIALAGSLAIASCGGGNGTLSPPTNLTATAGDAQVTLEWSAVAGATSYTLYWGTNPGITKASMYKSESIPSIDSPYTHEGLTNGTTYYYAVAAANSSGESNLSAEVSATPALGVPSAVQGLSITPGNKALTLNWTAYDGATSYNIYWDTSPGIDTSAPNSESSTTNNFLHAGLSSLNTYYYRVAAVNSVGEGALSEEKSAKPPIMGDTQTLGDEFGYAVAMDGDTALIGAPGYNFSKGTVFVYRYSGGTWSKEAELQPPGGITTNGSYGQAVAISGDLAIVGNPTGDGLANFSGLAVVFKRTGSSWAHEQTLQAGDGETDDKFGASVGISSEFAVVGAPDADKPGHNECGALYYWTVSGWLSNPPIPGALADDRFGYSVAVSGNVATVGAPYNDASVLNGGTIYFYSLDVLSLDSFHSGDDENGLFGTCVAIDGDVAIAGLSGKESAIIMRYSGGNWVEEYEVTPSSTAAGDMFGESCSISGDYAVVGAYLNDDTDTDAGAAFLFKNMGSTWSEEIELLSSVGASGDQFGFSVGISDDFMVIGANLADAPGAADAGAAYFY